MSAQGLLGALGAGAADALVDRQGLLEVSGAKGTHNRMIGAPQPPRAAQLSAAPSRRFARRRARNRITACNQR
jgi:hypothetical protein